MSLISAGGAVVTAITVLILNFRLFNSLERGIEAIERDVKDFFRTLADQDKRISRLEDRP